MVTKGSNCIFHLVFYQRGTDYRYMKARRSFGSSGILLLLQVISLIIKHGKQPRKLIIKWSMQKVHRFPSHSPKKSSCLLRAFSNKLLTLQRLGQNGIVHRTNGALCKAGFQKLTTYSFASLVQITSLQTKTKCGALWSRELVTGSSLYKEQVSEKRDRLYSIFLSTVVVYGAFWHLLQERNKRIFPYTKETEESSNKRGCKKLALRRHYKDINAVWGIANGELELRMRMGGSKG